MTTLFIDIDRDRDDPLHKQLILSLKNQVLNGEIEKGTRLPSSRQLAIDIGVSRIITITAYEQLIAEGYLVSRAGSGTFISDNIPVTNTSNAEDYTGPTWFDHENSNSNDPDDVRYNFSVGHTATHLLPEQSWKRAWRRAISQPVMTDKPNSAGTARLREALAGYLKRTRNINTSPDNIVITSGAAEALRLISKAMNEFDPAIYAEKPGYRNAWAWLSQCGEMIPVKVDENGFKISGLPKTISHPSLLFLTPSHQFPIGYRLSLKRRNEILEWATRNDALILEDDYDSEFHYESMPLPTLKSQDGTGNVLYFSSFSKCISPDIKIGYMIAPKSICGHISRIIADEHAEPPSVVQNAMAHFIASGDLDKHIAKSRRYYAKLNKIMREYLSDLPNGVTVSGLESGIHAFMSFKELPKELIKRLEVKSFHLPHQISENGWHGFALGYGHFKEDKLKEALEILVREIRQLYPEL